MRSEELAVRLLDNTQSNNSYGSAHNTNPVALSIDERNNSLITRIGSIDIVQLILEMADEDTFKKVIFGTARRVDTFHRVFFGNKQPTITLEAFSNTLTPYLQFRACWAACKMLSSTYFDRSSKLRRTYYVTSSQLDDAKYELVASMFLAHSGGELLEKERISKEKEKQEMPIGETAEEQIKEITDEVTEIETVLQRMQELRCGIDRDLLLSIFKKYAAVINEIETDWQPECIEKHRIPLTLTPYLYLPTALAEKKVIAALLVYFSAGLVLAAVPTLIYFWLVQHRVAENIERFISQNDTDYRQYLLDNHTHYLNYIQAKLVAEHAWNQSPNGQFQFAFYGTFVNQVLAHFPKVQSACLAAAQIMWLSDPSNFDLVDSSFGFLGANNVVPACTTELAHHNWLNVSFPSVKIHAANVVKWIANNLFNITDVTLLNHFFSLCSQAAHTLGCLNSESFNTGTQTAVFLGNTSFNVTAGCQGPFPGSYPAYQALGYTTPAMSHDNPYATVFFCATTTAILLSVLLFTHNWDSYRNNWPCIMNFLSKSKQEKNSQADNVLAFAGLFGETVAARARHLDLKSESVEPHLAV